MLPRIPVHRRLLPAQTSRHTRSRERPAHARRRRDRRPAPQARTSLHARRNAQPAHPQDPRLLEDPLRELDRQGRDRIRQIRLRPHTQGRYRDPGTRGEFLGYEESHPAYGGGGRVQTDVFGVPAVRIRRPQ